MIKISQNYEQLKILLEEALQEKKVVQKDFFQLNVKRTEVEENMMPMLLYVMDRRDAKKNLRVNFWEEGGPGGIVDHGAGKREFFTEGTKALFESSSVFVKEASSEYFYFKKGADPFEVKQGGFFIGLAVLNCVEIDLPIPVKG